MNRAVPFYYDQVQETVQGALTLQEAKRLMIVGLSISKEWSDTFGRGGQPAPIAVPLDVKETLAVTAELSGQRVEMTVQELFELPELRDAPPHLRTLAQVSLAQSQPMRLHEATPDSPELFRDYSITHPVVARSFA